MEDQKGIAFIMVLILIVVVGTLGISLLSASGFHLRFTGRGVSDIRAFYAAEAGVEYLRAYLNENNEFPGFPLEEVIEEGASFKILDANDKGGVVSIGNYGAGPRERQKAIEVIFESFCLGGDLNSGIYTEQELTLFSQTTINRPGEGEYEEYIVCRNAHDIELEDYQNVDPDIPVKENLNDPIVDVLFDWDYLSNENNIGRNYDESYSGNVVSLVLDEGDTFYYYETEDNNPRFENISGEGVLFIAHQDGEHLNMRINSANDKAGEKDNNLVIVVRGSTTITGGYSNASFIATGDVEIDDTDIVFTGNPEIKGNLISSSRIYLQNNIDLTLDRSHIDNLIGDLEEHLVAIYYLDQWRQVSAQEEE